MSLITPFDSALINQTAVSGFPVINTLAWLVNSIYVLIGGLVGLSILTFFLRWLDSRRANVRLNRIEASLGEVNEKLDKLIKKKS